MIDGSDLQAGAGPEHSSDPGDEVRAENARLWQELHRLRAERREVEYYERVAEQVTGSLSWRITTPLRSGKTLAAKVRRKLAERES